MHIQNHRVLLASTGDISSAFRRHLVWISGLVIMTDYSLFPQTPPEKYFSAR
jgi:hypothetical protein